MATRRCSSGGVQPFIEQPDRHLAIVRQRRGGVAGREPEARADGRQHEGEQPDRLEEGGGEKALEHAPPAALPAPHRDREAGRVERVAEVHLALARGGDRRRRDARVEATVGDAGDQVDEARLLEAVVEPELPGHALPQRDRDARPLAVRVAHRERRCLLRRDDERAVGHAALAPGRAAVPGRRVVRARRGRRRRGRRRRRRVLRERRRTGPTEERRAEEQRTGNREPNRESGRRREKVDRHARSRPSSCRGWLAGTHPRPDRSRCPGGHRVRSRAQRR